MQNKNEFVQLLHICADNGLRQRRWVRTKRNTGDKLRRMRKRGDSDKRVPVPLASRHFIYFDDRLFVSIPRSKYERKKSLEALINLVERHHLPEIAELLRTMKGVKRGSNVYWYSAEAASYSEIEAFEYESLQHYIQSLIDETPSLMKEEV